MRFYDDYGSWWPLFSAPEDYAEEAALYVRALKEAAPEARTLLELGSGGGNNACHMKAHFDLTLADMAAPMLQVSRALNPECPHHLGDMRHLRIGARFDAVFIQDAITHMATLEDLALALTTARAHLKAGGVVLVAPDALTETFAPGEDCGGHDSPDGARGMRYLEWTHPRAPGARTVRVDYVFLMREGDAFETVHDTHEEGIFSEAEWREAGRRAGLDLTVLDWEHSELPEGSYKGLLFRIRGEAGA